MASTPTARLDLRALKHAQSLAAVVSAAGIPLRPAGAGRLAGCCPFHEDRHPSFIVDERDQHFHCYGCRAHGDVIDFVMRREGLDFRRAIERLAGRPTRPRVPTAPPPSRERRWDRLTLDEQVVMNTAAAVYQYCLWHEPRALTYLRGRGLPDWLIRSAGLGYADGHSLEAWFRRRSGLRLAQELGLLGPRGRERLAGRVVVPELRGRQCIWLIGRRLDDAPERPKYLALPGERPVLGQEHAAGRREVFLAEGVLDYLTALAWRLPAWSPCGSYVPEERLGFLARARTIYGVFDADAAGRAATERFAILLGDRWRPVALPQGCDWNDLARCPDGQAEFFRLLAVARRDKSEGTSDGQEPEHGPRLGIMRH